MKQTEQRDAGTDCTLFVPLCGRSDAGFARSEAKQLIFEHRVSSSPQFLPSISDVRSSVSCAQKIYSTAVLLYVQWLI